MSITTSAPNGVIVTTPAKDSRLLETTLGSQAGANANQVIVPNAIGTNNQGNLTGSPSYVGRLFMLRPGLSSEEVRYITGDAANTLTVNEDWVTAPASGDDWAISYIIQDVATVTGLSLINKRVADYSSSRRLSVGDGTNFAWLAFVDGVSLETVDNGSTTVADFRVLNNARFDNGYLSSDTPVSGGYVIGTPATDGEMVFDAQAGCVARLYDFFLTCVKQNISQFNGDVLLRKAKIFSGSHTMDLTGGASDPVAVREGVIEGKGAASDTVEINADTDIDGLTLISTAGFFATGAITVDLRNVLFLPNNSLFVDAATGQQWNLVNPTWIIDTGTQNEIQIAGTGQVDELFSIDVTVTEPDGTAIQNARIKIYEGLLNGDLPHTGNTDANGDLSLDILKRAFTNNAGTSLTVAARGSFALKVYDYGRTPFVGALTVDMGIVASATLVTDPAITAATSALALSNPSGTPAITRHASGETDPRAMKVLHYDAGTGSVPTVGETMTQGSATGVVVEYLGDAVSGTLVLETWNGTEFTNNQTITGGASDFLGADRSDRRGGELL